MKTDWTIQTLTDWMKLLFSTLNKKKTLKEEKCPMFCIITVTGVGAVVVIQLGRCPRGCLWSGRATTPTYWGKRRRGRMRNANAV